MPKLYVNGSCLISTYDGETVATYCTENTTILLLVNFFTYGSHLGSVYLTCTEHGWFPPPPMLELPLRKKFFHIIFHLKCLVINYNLFKMTSI